ncbi:MAG TPA: RNA polymerase sigma factor [Candidatus Paceibacterota bacterium]|jgi:RNA polymerase sigma-70 factor (ECF subfamily)|nr:RNA polymerase sigma factor [Candidatus Paceibacterota bacterium]
MRDDRTDEELARRLQADDHQALETLMQRYTAKLMRYGRRFLASGDDVGDVVQDVFVAVYQNIRDFDPTRRFSPWIYRIAHNAFVDVLRKQAKGPVYGLDFDRFVPHPIYEDPVEDEKEKEEMRVLLEKHLDELPPSSREIIDLHYFEGFKYQEIADILHIPIGTVGIRLSRAKRRLKEAFREHRYE